MTNLNKPWNQSHKEVSYLIIGWEIISSSHLISYHYNNATDEVSPTSFCFWGIEFFKIKLLFLTLLSTSSKFVRLHNLFIIESTDFVTIVTIFSPGTSAGGLLRSSTGTSFSSSSFWKKRRKSHQSYYHRQTL